MLVVEYWEVLWELEESTSYDSILELLNILFPLMWHCLIFMMIPCDAGWLV
jgi:hypothetical protein